MVTLNQGDDRVNWAVALSSPRKHNNVSRRFFTSDDISLKYSSGKQKSHFNMFAVVSSMESSKKGESPLHRWKILQM